MGVFSELFDHKGGETRTFEDFPSFGFEWRWTIEQRRTDYWFV